MHAAEPTEAPRSFNLVTQRWIPVVRRNGTPQRLDMRTLLLECQSIRELAASNPIDNVAILRYLVSVLAWCHPGVSTEELLKVSSQGGVPHGWLVSLGELNAPNPLFDLLGTPRAHLQGPPDSDGERPVADLFHEIPGGTNIAHLRHVVDFRYGVCVACVAVGLVRLPATITAYGSGKSPGINGTPPVYFTPIGRSLAETIALNMPSDRIDGDCPCWAPTYGQREGARVGFLEGMSWTSRQFRIHGSLKGHCMLCGAGVATLPNMLFELNAPNGRPGLTSSPLESWRDPHVAYNRKGFPVRGLAADGALLGGSRHWRDWLGAMQGAHDASPPLAVVHAMRFPEVLARVDATAMITNKAKSVECVRIRYMPDVVAAPSEATAHLDGRIKDVTHETQSGLKPPRRAKLPGSTASSVASEIPNLESVSFMSAARTAPSRCRDTSEAWQVALSRVARGTTLPGILDVLEAQYRSLAAAGSPSRRATTQQRKTGERGNRNGAAR